MISALWNWWQQKSVNNQTVVLMGYFYNNYSLNLTACNLMKLATRSTCLLVVIAIVFTYSQSPHSHRLLDQARALHCIYKVCEWAICFLCVFQVFKGISRQYRALITAWTSKFLLPTFDWFISMTAVLTSLHCSGKTHGWLARI